MKTLEQILSYTKENETCLEWTRALNTDGYPRMLWKGNANGKVHRIVFELSTEIDPTGLVVRHKCDNIKCINPEHLELGTPKDNSLDRDVRGRTFKKITKEIVRDVLALQGMKQKDIAALIGIDPRRVSDILTGKYNEEGCLTRYL